MLRSLNEVEGRKAPSPSSAADDPGSIVESSFVGPELFFSVSADGARSVGISV